MTSAPPLLLSALRDPAVVARFSPAEWDLVLRQARRNGLLARLAVLIGAAGPGEHIAIPEQAAALLADATAFWRFNRARIRYEVERVQQALAGLDVPIILLKGGAYLMADLPPAQGRSASDLDILVPKASLPAVERALVANGWRTTKLDAYDQYYYRTWMHELPPLWHPERRIVVDVHHTIAPPTSRSRPDPAALLAAAVALPATPGLAVPLAVLGPADMVLHAATHLFNEEMAMGLRDLVDLHMLLSRFGSDPTFWRDLVDRASLHGLARPLYYLVSTCVRLLGTAVPAAVQADVRRRGAPTLPVRILMDTILAYALTPDHPDRPRAGAAVAGWLLYVRAHWLRMPPLLLARHLAIKARRRLWGDPDSQSPAAAPSQG